MMLSPLSYQGSIVISSPATVIRTVRRNPRLMGCSFRSVRCPSVLTDRGASPVMYLHLGLRFTSMQRAPHYYLSGANYCL